MVYAKFPKECKPNEKGWQFLAEWHKFTPPKPVYPPIPDDAPGCGDGNFVFCEDWLGRLVSLSEYESLSNAAERQRAEEDRQTCRFNVRGGSDTGDLLEVRHVVVNYEGTSPQKCYLCFGAVSYENCQLWEERDVTLQAVFEGVITYPAGVDPNTYEGYSCSSGADILRFTGLTYPVCPPEPPPAPPNPPPPYEPSKYETQATRQALGVFIRFPLWRLERGNFATNGKQTIPIVKPGAGWILRKHQFVFCQCALDDHECGNCCLNCCEVGRMMYEKYDVREWK